MLSISGPSKSWSPNTLKIRAVLNYKNIPYTQSFLSFTDIKPLFTSLDLPPNNEAFVYTLPVIVNKASASPTQNPHGAIKDSLPIALHLEKLFPSPSILPSGDASYALLVAVDRLMDLIYSAFWRLIPPLVVGHIDPRGQEYFHESRTKFLGGPLPEVRRAALEDFNELWKLIETESAPLIKILKGKEGKKGPFFEGEKPGLADFWLVSLWAFVERFDKELFGKIVGLGDGEFGRLYDASRPWLEGQGVEKEWVAPASS